MLSLGDGTGLALGAVVRGVGVDAAPEEGSAAVAGDGPVVHVVVGRVAAHLALHLPDELRPLPLRLLGTAAAAAGGRRRRRRKRHGRLGRLGRGHGGHSGGSGVRRRRRRRPHGPLSLGRDGEGTDSEVANPPGIGMNKVRITCCHDYGGHYRLV